VTIPRKYHQAHWNEVRPFLFREEKFDNIVLTEGGDPLRSQWFAKRMKANPFNGSSMTLDPHGGKLHFATGWYYPEDWGGYFPASSAYGKGDVYFWMEEPIDLQVRAPVVVYHENYESDQRFYWMEANRGTWQSDPRPLNNSESDPIYTVPAGALQSGVNVLTLRTNRYYSPKTHNPESTDHRMMSFWIRFVQIGTCQ